MYFYLNISFIFVFLMHSLHGVESFIRVDPDSAVTRALVSNKHLRAAELEIKRARVQLHWEGRLNNPELEISSSSDALGNGEGESVFEVAFAQQFPLTSKLRKARNLRQVQLGLAEAEVNDQRRDLANKVRTACIMIATAQQKKELYTKQSKLNEEIADFLDSAAERGEASVLDSTKARLAAKVFKQKTNAASSEIERWLGELRDLLSLPSESGLIVSADLQLPAESPSRKIDIKSALSRRPDYQVALIKTNLARAELSLAKANSLEDFAVKIFAERERKTDAPEGLGSNSMIGLSLSFPLPLRKRNESAIESANINISKHHIEADSLALNIENNIKVALNARQASLEAARESSSVILEIAEKNLKGYREAYSTGQVSFVQLQLAQEQKLDLEQSSLELVHEYHIADASVKYITATDIFSGISERRSTFKLKKKNP